MDGVRSDMQNPTNDESRGMRLYEVNRQRAVDRAIERIRYGLRVDWHYLTIEDRDNLRWIAGELWAVSTRAEWDAFRFSKLDLRSVRRLVGIGDRLRRHGTNRAAALESAAAVIVERVAPPSGSLASEDPSTYAN
ncbi:MAG: Uncharacterized protein XD74_0545 [Actinobacteria bacterium 66_15]|nr:MAG: Uncharacterized protein XD74_0545 [Actinobacteria bacterium 66_15]